VRLAICAEDVDQIDHNGDIDRERSNFSTDTPRVNSQISNGIREAVATVVKYSASVFASTADAFDGVQQRIAARQRPCQHDLVRVRSISQSMARTIGCQPAIAIQPDGRLAIQCIRLQQVQQFSRDDEQGDRLGQLERSDPGERRMSCVALATR